MMASLRGSGRAKRRWSAAVFLLLAPALLIEPTFAFAGPKPWEAEFDNGKKHWLKGECDIALPHFQRSVELFPTLEGEWAIVVTEKCLGRTLEAYQHLVVFLTKYEAQLSPERKLIVGSTRKELEEQLVHLKIAQDPPSAVVEIDGQVSSADVWLSPDVTHRVRVAAEGYEPKEESHSWPAGERPALSVHLTKKPPKDPDTICSSSFSLDEGADLRAALKGFRDAHALAPSKESKWAIIATEKRLERYPDAHKHLLDFLTDYKDQIEPACAEHVKGVRADLEAKMVHLRITTTPEGATIRIDGAAGAAQTWIMPGDHKILVSAPGYEAQTKSLSSEAGLRAFLEVRLSPAPPAPESPQRRASYVSLGLGAAGLVSWAVLGGVLLDKLSQMHALCPNEKCSPSNADQFLTLQTEGRDFAAAATTPLAIGLVMTGIGIQLYATSSRAAPKQVAFGVSRPWLSMGPIQSGALVHVGGAWR